MNSSLPSADGGTHIKVVVVSLLASIAVVVTALAVRSTPPTTPGIHLQAGSGIPPQAKTPLIRAGNPVTLTARDGIVVR
ncbi:MAG: hypothetical protein HY056_15755 [Proteobacteria bacterium]|nr:hypothetical protein [Pseudomonadota bacterium]